MYEPIRKGDWKFEFNMNYKNTDKVYSFNKKIKVNTKAFTNCKIRISPISMTIDAKVDCGDFQSWNGLNQTTKLIMKNSKEMKLNGDIGFDDSSKKLSMNFVYPVIIDINQVTGINIGGVVIPLNH